MNLRWFALLSVSVSVLLCRSLPSTALHTTNGLIVMAMHLQRVRGASQASAASFSCHLPISAGVRLTGEPLLVDPPCLLTKEASQYIEAIFRIPSVTCFALLSAPPYHAPLPVEVLQQPPTGRQVLLDAMATLLGGIWGWRIVLVPWQRSC